MKLIKYVITKFEPKEIEEERIPCSKLNGGKEEILYKPREPSEFEGKTIAIETSGILYDKDELKQLIHQVLEMIKENQKYVPKLKDKRFRDKTSKIELERAENQRCQDIIEKYLLKVLQ